MKCKEEAIRSGDVRENKKNGKVVYVWMESSIAQRQGKAESMVTRGAMDLQNGQDLFLDKSIDSISLVLPEAHRQGQGSSSQRRPLWKFDARRWKQGALSFR